MNAMTEAREYAIKICNVIVQVNLRSDNGSFQLDKHTIGETGLEVGEKKRPKLQVPAINMLYVDREPLQIEVESKKELSVAKREGTYFQLNLPKEFTIFRKLNPTAVKYMWRQSSIRK